MTNLTEIKARLSAHKDELRSRYKVKEIGIFGSYARGDYTSSSDLDILVDYSAHVTDMFDFLDLKEYLTNLMEMEVDLVMKEGLKPAIAQNILRQIQYA